MDKKLLKILVFLQKLQIESLQQLHTFDITTMMFGKEMIIGYSYQKKENSRMYCRKISNSWHSDDCKDLGYSLKDIRAFLKGKPSKKD